MTWNDIKDMPGEIALGIVNALVAQLKEEQKNEEEERKKQEGKASITKANAMARSSGMSVPDVGSIARSAGVSLPNLPH